MTTMPTGVSAYEQLRSTLDARQDTPEKRVGLDANRLVPLLTSKLETLGKDTKVLLAPYHPDVKKTLSNVLDRLPLLVLAFSYVHGRFERLPGATTQLQKYASEALKLRPAVFRNLDLMESLGLVSTEEANGIRAGRGYTDLGGDFSTVGALLRKHWAVLEPLQKLHPDEGMRLSTSQVERMMQLGDAITATANSDVDENDDTVKILQDLMILEALMMEDWTYLRAMVPAAYTVAGTPEKSEVVHYTLRGLQRQATPTSSATTPASDANAEVTTTPEPANTTATTEGDTNVGG